jgi:hypothetical protein
MQQEAVWPSSVIFVGVLNPCASLVALEEGTCALQQIMQSGLEPHVFVANSLVDIMQNVGWSVFNKMPSRDVVTWNARLRGCAMHGHGWELSNILNMLLNEFLKWSLAMLLVMCCCQTSTLLLATGISVRMLNSRERKKF